MIPADGTALDLAVRRLERAVAQLEQRQAARAAEAERAIAAAAAVASVPSSSPPEPSLFDDEERIRLVADLEAAREREKALEEAGEQASAALGRAIAEIRSALGDEFVANDDHAHDEAGHQEELTLTPEPDDDLFDTPEADDPKVSDPKVRDRGEA
ncbi:hypothetical protein [Caulobacter sp. UC70_42]|uniref:hypothetical protein n=1 Tax=Caulobacter sp. UC70_42 TaxID=3374551 RepID=UPI00375681B6